MTESSKELIYMVYVRTLHRAHTEHLVDYREFEKKHYKSLSTHVSIYILYSKSRARHALLFEYVRSSKVMLPSYVKEMLPRMYSWYNTLTLMD